ncbi:hypothetical protein D3C87_1739730 [compost metagenome]
MYSCFKPRARLATACEYASLRAVRTSISPRLAAAISCVPRAGNTWCSGSSSRAAMSLAGSPTWWSNLLTTSESRSVSTPLARSSFSMFAVETMAPML